MAPKSDADVSSTPPKDEGVLSSDADVKSEPETVFKPKIVWRNVALFTALHMGAAYGFYLLLFQAQWKTWLWVYATYLMGGQGITAGAHRLWAHKSYKAKWPLKLILTAWNCIAFQNDVIEWSRDHRCHHKFSETDADPHNANRGLFFAHIGWLLMKKHPEVIKKGKDIDISDLLADPILRFQRRHYPTLVMLLCFVVPSIVPTLWGESLWVGFYTAAIFRYALTLNVTWTVNSLAHMYGLRPYDKAINPRQNLITTIGTFGEGWHNYHHVFPSDYKASEYPWRINITTVIIDFFALIGWAYDRKATQPSVVAKKKLKSGE